MSHRSLWLEAATQAGGLLILEDDVVTHPALTAWIHQHHQQLLHAFGMCCCFVGPAGARRLLDAVFPLTVETAPIPLISNTMRGISIDRRLNALYPTLRAAITIPFLGYTPNVDSSTRD